MSDFIGYIGYRSAGVVLAEGFRRLKFKGNDAASIALLDNKGIIYEVNDKIVNVEPVIKRRSVRETIGIGYIFRELQLNQDSKKNYHNVAVNNRFMVIYEGLTENLNSLKRLLSEKGYSFRTNKEVDVISTLLDDICLKGQKVVEDTIQEALCLIDGAFGMIVVDRHDITKIYVVRRKKNVVIGFGDGEMFVASDAMPIIEYTNRILYLNDNEIAILSRNSFKLRGLNGKEEYAEISGLNLANKKLLN